MTDEEFDFEARYSHPDYPGVAWYSTGYYIERTYDKFDDFIEDIDMSQVYCIMVGDDRRFLFDVTDLIKLEEGDYCPECGQIGCEAYG